MLPIRILLADDHPLTREGITEFIQQEVDFELVASTENGIKAWEQIQALRPDVALLDIRMPGLDGVALAQKVTSAGLPTLTIILTSYDARQYVLASLRAGARGFVLKTAGRDELSAAINTVMKGGIYLDTEVVSAMVEPASPAASAASTHPSPASFTHPSSDRMAGMPGLAEDLLTPRERDVLLLSGKGLSSKEVASRLNIGDRTVETHLVSLYGKLGARNKTEAILLALKYGVVTLEELLKA